MKKSPALQSANIMTVQESSFNSGYTMLFPTKKNLRYFLVFSFILFEDTRRYLTLVLLIIIDFPWWSKHTSFYWNSRRFDPSEELGCVSEESIGKHRFQSRMRSFLSSFPTNSWMQATGFCFTHRACLVCTDGLLHHGPNLWTASCCYHWAPIWGEVTVGTAVYIQTKSPSFNLDSDSWYIWMIAQW